MEDNLKNLEVIKYETFKILEKCYSINMNSDKKSSSIEDCLDILNDINFLEKDIYVDNDFENFNSEYLEIVNTYIDIKRFLN